MILRHKNTDARFPTLLDIATGIVIQVKTVKRDLKELRLRAAFAPASANAESRTVDVVWTTGAKVLRSDWEGSYYEELSLDPAHVRMARLNNGAPFLANHDRSALSAVMGVVESARIQGNEGTARVRFAKAEDDPEADKVFRKILDGIIQNISVGYRIHRVEKQAVSKGETPTYRAIDWEPFELSAVPVGADDAAGFRSFMNEESTMNEAEQKVADEAKRTEEAKHAAELQAEQLRAEVAALTKERDTATIRSLVAKHALGDAFAEKLVAGGVSVPSAREAVLEALAQRTEAVRIQSQHVAGIEIGEEDREKWVRGATAGILARSGQLTNLAQTLADQKAKNERQQNPDLMTAFAGFDPKDNGGEFRNFSLVDLARESLERRGIKTRGLGSERLVQRALDYARDNGGQQTGSDFSVALENVMYKTLLGEYARQADTWRRFCGVDSTVDFRPSNRYRLGSFGVLDHLDESGEYKQKTIPDAVKQQVTTDTYGNKIALSRKAIINDDMGAIVASAARFGRMAGLSIEVAIYSLLAQNGGLGPSVTYNGITAPLFDAQFANLGTGAAFSMAAIDSDRVKMASQVDISNNEKLDIAPNVLLVPLSLGSPARALNRDAYDPTPGAAFQAPNYVAGLFRDIVDTARLTGTRRYLFSDQTPALLVVFLNGTQVPVMEERLGWDIDGIEWKVRLDFNAQGFDPKGALTNAGA